MRTRAIAALAENYFVKKTVVQAGYPLDMRYAGPREALLHALFRQNYGCSHQIVGRDHAGVGSYYGPFDAHHIFDQIPKGALETQPLKIDVAFWCYKCGGMASGRTCPHDDADRLQVSGTQLRKWLSEGTEVPPEFSRPEVLAILREYYAGLDRKQSPEASAGEVRRAMTIRAVHYPEEEIDANLRTYRQMRWLQGPGQDRLHVHLPARPDDAGQGRLRRPATR